MTDTKKKKRKKYTYKPKPFVYPTKPLREFSFGEFRSYLCKIGIKPRVAGQITDTTFINEFMVLVSCTNGEDLYTVNAAKLESLTKEDFDKLIAKQNATRQKKHPHHFLVSYLAQWDDGSFSVEEETVVITGTVFKGKDGKTHNIDSKTVKVLEQLD